MDRSAQFRSTVEHAQNAIVGAALLLTGAALMALELSGRGDDPHEHGHGAARAPGAASHRHEPAPPGPRSALEPRGPGQGRVRGVASIMVPFGAAASPDLTILPVFAAATAVGAGTAVGSLIAFAAATIGTIVALTLIAVSGGYRMRSGWLERRANHLTGAVLIAVGALVIAGAI